MKWDTNSLSKSDILKWNTTNKHTICVLRKASRSKNIKNNRSFLHMQNCDIKNDLFPSWHTHDFDVYHKQVSLEQNLFTTKKTWHKEKSTSVKLYAKYESILWHYKYCLQGMNFSRPKWHSFRGAPSVYVELKGTNYNFVSKMVVVTVLKTDIIRSCVNEWMSMVNCMFGACSIVPPYISPSRTCTLWPWEFDGVIISL